MPQRTRSILPAVSRRLAELTKHRAHTRERISQHTGLSSSNIQAVTTGTAILLESEIETLAGYVGMSVSDFLDLTVPLGNPFVDCSPG